MTSLVIVVPAEVVPASHQRYHAVHYKSGQFQRYFYATIKQLPQSTTSFLHLFLMLFCHCMVIPTSIISPSLYNGDGDVTIIALRGTYCGEFAVAPTLLR